MSAHLVDTTLTTGLTSGGFAGTTSMLLTFAVAAGAVVALLWRMLACQHPGPLGLLPPTTDDAGGRVPARWFCDRCGKSWAAAFDHEKRPTPKFTGYDPTKAVQAAKRADELAASRRSLAVKRAGVESARPAIVTMADEPVPFRRRIS